MRSERGKRSLKTMLGLTFSRSFQLWIFCGRQDRDFALIVRRASIVDESTALPRASDGTKEVGLSYHTAITLCLDFSDISA
ncbi:Bgt-20132 [Blumeria graminis f. sp. tritici]|uniref:Bgt-20132 n=2 Tax=Blumeria graminis f. sp. tritici TaxID=62690 RepID=A0A9X9L9J2_BLUGR|nr:Bgt-20132 [Blumeria graminis f. sp. tritici]